MIASESGFHLGVLSSRFHIDWAIRAGGWLSIGNDPIYVKSRCFDPFPFPLATPLQKLKIAEIAEEIDAHRKTVLASHPNLTLTGLYNVRAKLHAGEKLHDLNFLDRQIFDEGLVLILHELHEKLDTAVAEAYGWDAALPAEKILERLVALNAERAREEAAGKVHWLRPEYQIPKFGAPAEKLDLQGGIAAAAQNIVTDQKRPFPKAELDQTDVVVAALLRGGKLESGALAARFTQGRKVLPQIDAVLAALVARGEVARLRGGYVLQRLVGLRRHVQRR